MGFKGCAVRTDGLTALLIMLGMTIIMALANKDIIDNWPRGVC